MADTQGCSAPIPTTLGSDKVFFWQSLRNRQAIYSFQGIATQEAIWVGDCFGRDLIRQETHHSSARRSFSLATSLPRGFVSCRMAVALLQLELLATSCIGRSSAQLGRAEYSQSRLD
jgi:hypothetical protein